MRKLLLIAWLLAAGLCCLAQQEVSLRERDEMIRQVILASEGIRTLQCEFLQEKKLSIDSINVLCFGISSNCSFKVFGCSISSSSFIQS